MSKVYIVTAGSYGDDYHNEFVCLDKELAEQIVIACESNSEEGYEIEEWEIDNKIPKMYWYKVNISINEGELMDSRKLPFPYKKLKEKDMLCSLIEANQYRVAYIEAYGSTEEEAIENAINFRKEYLSI